MLQLYTCRGTRVQEVVPLMQLAAACTSMRGRCSLKTTPLKLMEVQYGLHTRYFG